MFETRAPEAYLRKIYGAAPRAEKADGGERTAATSTSARGPVCVARA
jgi:hypothetical protein